MIAEPLPVTREDDLPTDEIDPPNISMHLAYRRVQWALAAVRAVARGEGCLTEWGAWYLGLPQFGVSEAFRARRPDA